MNFQSSSTRREFLATASAAVAATVLPRAAEAQAPKAVQWPLGCHTRPFSGFRASQSANPDYVLDAVKAAGYQYSDMISPAPPPAPSAGRGGAAPGAPAAAPPGRSAPVTPEMIAAFKEKLTTRGLKSNIASLATAAKGVALPDAIANARQVITTAHGLGQKFALNLGVEDEERWVDWCKVLAEAAAFGKERGVKVVVKHHHGLNNTSLDLLAWIKQVNHPNFGVFFDPGNVVYYTGKDPVKQLEIIGPHVSGVVAKDCNAPHFLERAVGDPPFGAAVTGAGNPEVMIQFGTGKVDFAAFFKKLKWFGFNGPVMVEGTEVGTTLEQTIANARANREFLENVFASA
ncbi:MAG: sugar phosphate isomerase/epimerase family protein [Acidobacteriota bacterium]